MDIHEILDTILERGNNPTRIVSLITKTFPTLLKKGRESKNPCPWERGVAKISQRYGIIGCNYASCVNRERRREWGDFRSENPQSRRPHPMTFQAQLLWNGYGEHVPGSPYLVRHKDRDTLYLAFLPFNRDGEPAIGEEMYHDVATGEIIEPGLLTEYLRPPSVPVNQGVEKSVFWRTIELSHILQVKCGEVYDVTPAAA